MLISHGRYLSSFAASMMKIIYDNDIETEIEEQMIRVDMTQEGVSQGLVPGKYIVDILPFIRHLPSWFLGAELRVKSREWQSAANDLKNIPYNRVIEEMVRTVRFLGRILDLIAHFSALYRPRTRNKNIARSSASSWRRSLTTEARIRTQRRKT